MGGEFGQWNEWNFRKGLDWDLADHPMNARLTLFLQDLNRLYRERKELNELDFAPDGFEWIDFQDVSQSVITFIRKSRDNRLLLMAFNMTPEPRFKYRVGVPRGGFYKEILNSDASEYAGSGLGNFGWCEVGSDTMEQQIPLCQPNLATPWHAGLRTKK